MQHRAGRPWHRGTRKRNLHATHGPAAGATASSTSTTRPTVTTVPWPYGLLVAAGRALPTACRGPPKVLHVDIAVIEGLKGTPPQSEERTLPYAM